MLLIESFWSFIGNTMAILTLPLCYNVFAVFWSTLSLFFSGPVYMEIQSFGDSLCYHPGHQALPIHENPLCYDDQCEGMTGSIAN